MLTHFVPQEQVKNFREHFCRKLVDEGETSYESEVITKDGHRIAVEVSSHPFVIRKRRRLT